MKKILSFIVAALMAVPTFAQMSRTGGVDASNLYYGARIGFNISSLTGDVDAGSKFGLNLGGVIGLALSDEVFLESGLYFSGRGAKDGKDHINYNNIDIPLFIKYGFKPIDELGVIPLFGPVFSYAISGKTKIGGVEMGTFDEKQWAGLKRANLGLRIGCGVEYNKLYGELAYQFGLNDLSKNDGFSTHCNAFFLNLGVNF